MGCPILALLLATELALSLPKEWDFLFLRHRPETKS